MGIRHKINMSSFPGRMREYSLISIDRFDGKNLDSSVYFLSHNHADHTVGLDQSLFQYRLSANNNIKLYCSVITKDLLLLDDKYKCLKNSIVGLEVNEPCPIAIVDPHTGKEKDEVTVTLLPAEHCPGSVMILFEGSEGTVLYTGDFRLSRTDLINMQHLHAGARPKEIKCMYTDTTFCVPQALYIPSRDDSIQAVIDIVQEWISQSQQHVINIKHKAALGYENLFKSLCLHFKMKVHVHPNKYKQYQKVADMAQYTTPDPSETQIHACKWMKRHGSSPLPCGYMPTNCKELHMRTITVSTMFFVERVGLETYAKGFNDKYFRVCYSFHSSYSEVRDMVLYLQPVRAVPNVIPLGETMERIQMRIDQFVELAKTNVVSSSSDKYKALGKLKVRKRKLPKLSQQSKESADLHFGDIGESPVKLKRHKLNSSTEQDGAKNKSAGDLGSEFPLLFGDAKGDSEDLLEDTGKEAEGEAGSTDYGSEEGEDLDLHLSMSEEDRDHMEHFTPRLPDVYGSVLGYISEEESDVETDLTFDDIDKKDKEDSGVEITACELPAGSRDLSTNSSRPSSAENQESGVEILSLVLPNGRVDLAAVVGDPKPEIYAPPLEVTACVLPNGRIDLADDMSYTSADEKSPMNQSSGKNQHVSGGTKEVADCGNVKSIRGNISQDQRKITEPSDGVINTSADSGDVILLEDDDCTTKKSSTGLSPDKTTDSNDHLPSTFDSDATRDCSRDATDTGKDGADKLGDGGMGVGNAVVMCTIDLTEMDEEEDVYPSTSSHDPPLYGYHGENLFSRFSHPAMKQGAGALEDEDIEYSEKEVACSDEECECGGKAKGGTHKYMVPRPKKVLNRPAAQPNWTPESEGSEDENPLEQPAHVRTRKWIESQSLYMQRRNYLNSQPVPSSEVIVIDSDDEAEGTAEGMVTSTKDDICGDDVAKRDSSGANVVEMQVNGKDIQEGNSSEKQTIEKDEASTVQNREKDTLSVDLSLTSGPTNLSMLAQASDPSLKSAVVNDVGSLVKMVNGDPSDHADTNEPGSIAPTDVDDKESAN